LGIAALVLFSRGIQAIRFCFFTLSPFFGFLLHSNWSRNHIILFHLTLGILALNILRLCTQVLLNLRLCDHIDSIVFVLI
jgi:hypothetical protein